MGIKRRKEHCFIETHSTSDVSLVDALDVRLVPVVTTIPVVSHRFFEDFTTNHNKAFVEFRINPVSAVLALINAILQMQLIDFNLVVKTRGMEIPQEIPIRSDFAGQFEDLEWVAFRLNTQDNLPEPIDLSLVIGNLRVQKTFCICCGGEDSNRIS
ncbi:hypothetical protein [Ammoniphilus sp. CFH 90114]|uniref:hypothetical protein n=1 Tax=Ammoniphilus sp. CFH 90114 TaxID=2493665 RepID=UPI00100F63BE|nr:hypothetical protein [Ammoniphilus sp. CFH 90114]RXT01945.1 hypothetical protein EIZ39_25235 [Ammoniphilus sp. CFH 90114]